MVSWYVHLTRTQVVVFEPGESFRAHELELRDQIVSGVLREHAEVRCIVQLELASRVRGLPGSP